MRASVEGHPRGASPDYENSLDVPLPVQLSTFSGASTQNGILLQWRTASETNNVGFNIYRSTNKDGRYTKIGFVEGQGSTPVAHDYTFTDKTAKPGETYYYYLEDIDIEGKTESSDVISVSFKPQSVPLKVLPTRFALYQNFPNPFNPETWIPYDLAAEANVRITIYNVHGQRIRTLELGTQAPGAYQAKDQAAYWDGQSDAGELVSSGLYFYHLQAGDYHATKKMLVLK